MRSIGVIGLGQIGKGLVDAIAADQSLRLAFAMNRSAEADLSGTSLVIEAAHPDVTRDLGTAILRHCDYMPLSTGALVDDALRTSLLAMAARHGTRLIVPRGAVVGLDSLLAGSWDEVDVTFVKPPQSIIDASGHSPDLLRRTVLYDGPVRGVAERWPRNVNAMVTLALATVGLDACVGRLISDPEARNGSLEIIARSADGARLEIRREQPMKGVSGTEMLGSALSSMRLAVGRGAGPLVFC